MRKAIHPFLTSSFSCLTVLLYKDIGMGGMQLLVALFFIIFHPYNFKKMFFRIRQITKGMGSYGSEW